MKEQNLIDRLFREKLYDYKVERPDHLWTGIEQQLALLEKSSSGFRWVYFFLGTALTVVTLGGIYWYNATPPGRTYQGAITADSHTQVTQNGNRSNTSNRNDPSLALQPSKEHWTMETMDNGNDAGTNASMVSSRVNQPSENYNQKSSNNKNVTDPSINYLKTHTIDFGESSETLVGNKVDQNRQSKTYPSYSNALLKNVKSSTDLEVISQNSNNTEENQGDFYYNESGQKVYVSVDQNRLVKAPTMKKLPSKGLEDWRTRLIHMTQPRKLDFRIPSSYWSGSDDCMEMVEKPFKRQYLEVLAGPVKAKRLFYTEDSILQNNVASRNQSEKAKSAYFIGMRYVWNINRDIAVKTGITLTQVNETMTYQDGFNISVNINKNGDTVGIKKSPRYRVKDNQYSFLDLPIMLSYTWRKDRFFFDFNSGINVNIYALQTGYYFTPEEKVTAFNESKVYPYKHFAGISLLMSGTLGYYLGYNTSVFFEPGIRYFTTSLSSKDYPIKQKYVNYRMNLGVRYRFNGK